MSSLKAPRVKLEQRHVGVSSRNPFTSFVPIRPDNEYVVILAMASGRTQQGLTIKQAEALAKKLMRLVNESKVREVQES